MDRSLHKSTLLLAEVFLFAATAVALALYLPSLGSVDLEARFFILFTVLISLFLGLRGGLITTLIILFLFGSLYFWNLLFRPQDQLLLFNEVTLLFYGFSLVVLTILAGTIHEQVNSFRNSNLQLKNQVRQLVAIDVETGFDNNERFELELQLEINRTNRHGGEFTVFLYKIDYLSEFQKLYGQLEYERFLQFFSERMIDSTRTTDKKFRLDHEDFALILPYASENNMGILYNRFKEMIGEYELTNGHMVSFTNHVAHYTISKESAIKTPDDVRLLLRNELKSNAL